MDLSANPTEAAAEVVSERNPFGCYDRQFFKELLPVPFVLGAAVAMKLLLRHTVPLWVPRGLTAMTMAYTILITVGAIRRLDELEQRIHLVAIAISFALTGILVTTADLLEKDGFPRIDGSWLWLIMVAIWVVGVFVLRRRYR